MLALSLGVAISVLVNAGVNIALPTMSDALRTSASDAVWIVNAYQLAVAVALLPMAAWGERIGHLRVYRAGLATFLAASLACAMAPSFGLLLPARALQGLGAAGIMAVNTALLRAVYPKAQLGRGVGLNAMVVAVSAAAGPPLGGGVLAFGSWPGLFVLFALLAVLAMGIGRHALADAPRRGPAAAVDGTGVILQALAIVAFIVGIGSFGKGGGWPVVLVGLAVALGTLFVRRELRLGSPLLPLDLLGQRRFALSFAASLFSFIAQMLALVALPFSLHRMGFAPERIGLLMTPWPLAVMVIAPFAGALSDRWSANLLGGLGLGLSGLALALLASIPTTGVTEAGLIWRVALCGIGFALFSAPNVRTLVAAAPVHRSAAVGAMIAISRQTGQTLGAALAGALLGLSAAEAGPSCFAAAAAISLLAAGLSVMRRR